MSGDGSDEREFLHDLATPLGTAMFLVDSLLDDLQLRPGVDPTELHQLSQAFQALEKLKVLLYSRREVLIKRGVPSARS